MIEIALCLAIIGFGLIAIIGVLPAGLNVQKNNREETIINQDAQVWMDAVRNGAEGYDYLTNYVTQITLTRTRYNVLRNTTNRQGTVVYTFTPTNSNPPGYLLTNAFNIVGLLSTPQIESFGTYFLSNNVVAQVRSISGPAVEKFPQTNETVLDSSFAYRLVVENAELPVDWPYIPLDPTGKPVSNDVFQTNFKANSRDLRLLFRWPLFPGGKTGTGRQTFRSFVGGSLHSVRPGRGAQNDPTLYFFQPSTYVQTDQ